MYLDQLFGLQGKVAVVTGGSRGIGRVAALGLARAGAEVVVLSRSSAEETVSLIKEEGLNAYWISTDVTDESSVEAAFAAILTRSGSVDIVFNNAGIANHQNTANTALKDFHAIFDVNLFGEFLVARAAAKIMIQRGIRGSIINMASMSGSIVNLPQWQCSYNASKAAVIHMTKSMAVEWIPYGIRVNSISPGYIETPATVHTPLELREDWNRRIPMGRMGTPEELLPVLLYLACDASSYTTGSDSIVDGAYTCV